MTSKNFFTRDPTKHEIQEILLLGLLSVFNHVLRGNGLLSVLNHVLRGHGLLGVLNHVLRGLGLLSVLNHVLRGHIIQTIKH